MKLRLFSAAVALTSCASLALSLLFTRLFSVTAYYHFAFLLISLALLGIAAGGVGAYLLPSVFRAPRLPWLAGMFAVAIAPLAAFALWVAVRSPLSVDLRGENLSRMARVYVATALPFLASGFSLTCAVSAAGKRIGPVYAFDMGGAALGCLLVIPLLSLVGGPGAVLAVGALAAGGGALFALSASPAGKGGRILAGVGVLAAAGSLALLAAQMGRARPFRIAQTAKFLREDSVVFERWNAFSRVTVSDSSQRDHKWIHIDADAATRMFSGEVASDGYAAPRRYSEVRLASLVYSLRREGPALIIGPGGGPDVLSALRQGVPRVVGVEVNPIIVRDVMRGRFAGFNGDLYRDPRLQVVVDDGRSFIRRSRERYSSIQATLVDTWAASTSGAFALTENNLYTVEAFTEYLQHLEPDGILSMTRWYARPPREFLRLVALGRAALERLGATAAEIPGHFFVAADERMATMLLKLAPFTEREIETLREECDRAGLRALYPPTPAGRDRFIASLLSAPDAASFLDALPFDASPPSDDRPFFFNSMRRRDFPWLLASAGTLERNNLGLALLQALILLSIAATFLWCSRPWRSPGGGRGAATGLESCRCSGTSSRWGSATCWWRWG